MRVHGVGYVNACGWEVVKAAYLYNLGETLPLRLC